jgi:hypothetical protein
VLGTYTLVDSITATTVVPHELDFQITITPNLTPLCVADAAPTCLEILSGALTPADVGSQFVINESNNPEFASIVQLLTNGVDNGFCLATMIGGPVTSASSCRTTDETNLNAVGGGPDFATFTISDLSLTVNSLTIDDVSLGSICSDCTMADYSLTLNVDGTAPEPGSWVLLSLGVAGAGGALFRRRRRLAAN